MMQLQTQMDDITATRLVALDQTAPDFVLSNGDILLTVERFAFTANNVTYGAIGHLFDYWKFFPAHGAADVAEPWGVIPVWACARVVESRHAEIEVGMRLYGYFPLATHLRIAARHVSAERLIDGAAHRAALPPVYNHYQWLGAATADATTDNLRVLLYPLYITSFCLCDALEDAAYHGAEQLVIVSASSKTALGLAYGLSQLGAQRPKIVGITSPANIDFVRSLQLYDQVIAYDDLAALPSRPSALVDMSGNRGVLGRLHAALGEQMRFTHSVGLTHRVEKTAAKDPDAEKMISERSALFFAPAHIQKRVGEWGVDVYNQRVADFFTAASAHARGWMRIREIDGLEAFVPIYKRMINGDLNPEEGLVVRLEAAATR